MATSISGLSASVTRILYLTGFPKELKTKDIQTAFTEWEGVNGGFKIKWRDDTSLLIVFQDASVAKRAYLHTIAYPPPILTSTSGASALIRPYDEPDAQTVIQTVNSRGQHTSNPSRHISRGSSISGFQGGSAHGRGASQSNNNGFRNVRDSQLASSVSGGSIPEHPALTTSGLGGMNGREPSPTLPSLPSHPTLNSLINSSLGENVSEASSDPSKLTSSAHADTVASAGGPRIGDAGKRMMGAALGVKHPGLAPRMMNGGAGDQGMRDVRRAMGGLTVAE